MLVNPLELGYGGVKTKTVCVLGLGYIGLPTACLLAAQGYQVIGVDLKKELVETINQGGIPFREPGLEELLKKAREQGKFVARLKPETADVFLISVPTPLDTESRMAELIYVRKAAESIVSCLKKGSLVILESTVPPGTCKKLLTPILENSGFKCGEDLHLAHCPERAIPGNTIHEMTRNHRIIGGVDKTSAELAKELYSSFVTGNFYLTDLNTAEMVKLMENTFRDINIALANEFAQIAEDGGVNVWEAIELANKHPRVNILKPGPGVGGHCIAIDPWFLAENSVRSRIISMAREINDSMPRHVLTLVKELVDGIKNPTITILGVSYKGDVDDTRETPAIKLIKLAENEGFKVKSHDPWAKEFQYPLCSLKDAVHNSDCLVLITDHSVFKKINPREISPQMRNKNLLDTRNILNHEQWIKEGFKVKVLGEGVHQG